jgi:glycosyltransferase involved in cell wall biosynthesis
LNYPQDKLEVIVAADGSTDATVSIVENFTSRKVVLSYSKERAGKLAAIAALNGALMEMSSSSQMPITSIRLMP